MFLISDFVTIINIRRIKNQKNTMFANVASQRQEKMRVFNKDVVLLFSLNNVFAFSTKVGCSQINIYFFGSFVIVKRLNKDQFNASFYFVGVPGKTLIEDKILVWLSAFDEPKTNFVPILKQSN